MTGDDSKQLMELFLHGEYRVTQRSAWIISYCADQHPELITPWLPAMMKKTQEPGIHDAVPRNVMRILQNIDIPRSILGTVMAQCFEYIASPNYPVAVQANAMTVLSNIAMQEPEIINELRATIDQEYMQKSPALRSRIKKVMKQISNENNTLAGV